MPNYKEIVTKAILGKGKKLFTTTNKVTVENKPTTILGCWVINHTFKGDKTNNVIQINGAYDVNIWYSYDNDTKTDVIREHNIYKEFVNIRATEDAEDEDIIVRSLKQPSCVKVDIEGNNIVYTVEKELGIELVGNTKVRIATEEDDDDWEDIVEEANQKDIDKIDNEVKEEYLENSLDESNNS